jgi:type I restriction enzyme S subunit
MALYSKVNLSYLVENKRFDSEFNKPIYLEYNKLISKLPHEKLGNLISLLTDYHANGSYEVLNNHVKLLDNKDFCYVVRTTDLENDNYKDNLKYYNEYSYNYLKKTKIYGGELLINKIGSAGKNYLMPFLDKPVSLGMNLFLIRTPNQELTNYLFAYLQCKYGATLIEQKLNGTVPYTITKDGVRSVVVPLLENDSVLKISNLISDYNHKKIEAIKTFEKANNILNKELGLDTLVFDKPKSYVANFSEVVENLRADADFYQTKFKQLASHLNCLQTEALGKLCTFRKGYEVGSKLYTEDGPLFIRVSNLTKDGFKIGNSDKYISNQTYSQFSVHQPKLGDILLTKDGTIGTCYVVDEDVKGIISSGILNLDLRSTDIPREYLALVINSKVCSMQADRDCSGALITHWKPEQIRKMRIPILSKEVMDELSNLVIASKKARKESIQLLEEAKKQVEDLIENQANQN